ncbi:hypothetical protein [Allocoleopsis franciscana]|uniref:Uncharacterized protein n=1 Tax=Allocoleopsis franciscana PCC 7113 TaxID=1173027 RepID=K9WGX2_9CYAN|nr:hypothetical protein [Allocoleopsis franciscana]AFZ19024.1 hypothetical protein Mic7113_3288 [Allocoleopsis franciscana PCC 7113]
MLTLVPRYRYANAPTDVLYLPAICCIFLWAQAIVEVNLQNLKASKKRPLINQG